MDTESKQGKPAAKVPHFITEARPLRVPPELLALAHDDVVNVHCRFGNRSETMCSAGDYRDEIEGRIARQSQGFYTVDEAAQVLADSRQGADVRRMLEKMHKAYRDGKLPICDPGDQLPKVVSDFHRDYLDLVKVCDIDAWLTQVAAGYLFPPAAAAESPSVPAAAPETAKQRRARLLAMFDAESAAGREHGALARITEMEKRTRLTADRSNIGKDIKKAREERDAERRGGALARLLG